MGSIKENPISTTAAWRHVRSSLFCSSHARFHIVFLAIMSGEPPDKSPTIKKSFSSLFRKSSAAVYEESLTLPPIAFPSQGQANAQNPSYPY